MEQSNIKLYGTNLTKMTPAFTALRLDEFVQVYERSFQCRTSPKQDHTLKTVGENTNLHGFYIEQDDSVAGYIIGSIKPKNNSVYIEQVCIAPEYQNHGFGTDLVNVFVRAMRKGHDIHNFTLRTDAIKAHNLYAKTDLGPVIKELSENFYHFQPT